ncbi:hypothetical protein QTI33_09115 [Variovorax sp. J22P271]|uniref:hypothetical protein n=1 Tax=Variovorax davisae TaxID=3053515 RepID=UPI002578D26F|nr:hypothetical protein [Variovorax sp. J22P271]MDM0032287.1 hypothetical protein [Variovorax sp. J22P271]
MVNITAEDVVTFLAGCAVIAVLIVILISRLSGTAPVKQVAPVVYATPEPEATEPPQTHIDLTSLARSNAAIQRSA